MKSLIKWILFVPVCLLSVGLMLFSSIAPDTVTKLFATDINGVAEIIAFSVLGLFVVCFLLSLFDKKTASVYLLKKNYATGIVGLLSAFSLAASAAFDVSKMVTTEEFTALGLITVLFTVLSGVAMLFVGLNHCSGANTPKAVSILYLSLPLWCGVHLIDRFMKHTAMPVAAAETLDLIMFVALAMFFIYAMMIHAVIPTKGTVKYTITFGFPASVICLVFCISEIFAVDTTESINYLEYLPALTYGLIGLYAILFTAELSSSAKNDAEIEVVDATLDEHSEYFDEEYDEYEEEFEDEEDNNTDSDEFSSVAPVDKFFEDADNKDVASEADTNNYVEEQEFVPAKAAVVRVASEDYDAEDDKEDDMEDDVAQELLFAAKRQDERADVAQDETIAGSEDDMIIENEIKNAESSFEDIETSEKMPKGPTTREAIMFDDDFILSVDSKDSSDVTPRYNKDEDISAFILEKSSSDDDNQTKAKQQYNSRLDEIDQLIISIQGGNVDDQKED